MSGVTFDKFDPREVAWQWDAIKKIKNFEYGRGVHEVLFSGSVGCLREETPVSTAFGEVPIGSISQSMLYACRQDHHGQYLLRKGSGAFPKGKDYLYRVISEREEYVAAANHLLISSNGVYLSVASLQKKVSSGEEVFAPYLKRHGENPSLSPLDAQRCLEKFSSFLSSYLRRTHQCDQLLLPNSNNALSLFQRLADAPEYGLSFSEVDTLREDGYKALKLIRDHCAELSFHAYRSGSLPRCVAQVCAEECQETLIRLFERSHYDILRFLQFHCNSEHHQRLLLLLLAKLNTALLDKVLIPSGTPVKDKIIAVEKLTRKEWYWDLSVPGVENYIGAGHQHHNSGKTLPMAHLSILHMVENPGAGVMIGRQSMPDLKETLLQEILDHMEGCFEEGRDYEFNRQKVKLTFYNGSTMIGLSWSKKNWKRFGSFKFSLAAIEEINENHGDYWRVYEAVYQRLGRVHGIKENLLIGACNPDSPAHPLYKRLFESNSELRHVFYSDTRDNPFLPKWYIENLMENLSPIEVERKVKGRWVEDPKGGVYYNYDSRRNYRNEEYVFDLNYPIAIMHDFNIAQGKPMSAAVGQYIAGVFHVARSYLVDGADTIEIMEEMEADGIFERHCMFEIYGDATGSRRDTRSKKSDYDLIRKFLDNHRRDDGSRIGYTMKVPKSNPPVRTRHNKVNAKFKDPFGEVRFYVYKGAYDADRGFRLTKLKKGSNYVEDDTLREQHVTTAIGYWICKKMKGDRKATIRTGSR